MLWLSGPAGIGKSAIAQTIAEHCHRCNRLGGALFFSKSRAHANPNRIIPTLAYQFAEYLPAYKQLISQRLIDNPTIPDLELISQFKELIAKPFATLEGRNAQCEMPPIPVILDELDDCEGRESSWSLSAVMCGTKLAVLCATVRSHRSE